jgi:hypothetical protein
LDDVNLGYVKNLRRCEHEGHSVENLETFVDGDLQDGGRGVERTIDGADALAVPTPAGPERPLAAVPGRGMDPLIKTPDDKTAARKRCWKGRHV